MSSIPYGDYFISTGSDITEQIKLQKELEDNKNTLSAAIQGADLGVFDFDAETGSIKANDRWFEMLGFEPNHDTSNESFFASLIHPDDGKKIYDQIQKIENGAKNNIDETVRVKTKDGNYKTILDRAKIVEFDSNGKAKRIIGTHLDISQKTKLQEEIQKSLEEKTILLGEIHHRVKNNLAIISGLLDLQALETKSEEISSIVLNMGQRIKSIAGVHELLYKSKDFSNIPFIEYVDILLKNVNNTLHNSKSVAFDISIDDSVIININQAVPVGLLMNELITNSFKYAFHEVDKPKITFSMKFLKGTYHAEYSDNGPGIDLESIEASGSLGFTLIQTLLAQIAANYTFKSDNGFKLAFNFSPQDSGAQGNKVNY
jgi:PAS domain S-box-containing protein